MNKKINHSNFDYIKNIKYICAIFNKKNSKYINKLKKMDYLLK